MNPSGRYVVVEYLIRQKKVWRFELKHPVTSLERGGLITPEEHQVLFRLGDSFCQNFL